MIWFLSDDYLCQGQLSQWLTRWLSEWLSHLWVWLWVIAQNHESISWLLRLNWRVKWSGRYQPRRVKVNGSIFTPYAEFGIVSCSVGSSRTNYLERNSSWTCLALETRVMIMSTQTISRYPEAEISRSFLFVLSTNSIGEALIVLQLRHHIGVLMFLCGALLVQHGILQLDRETRTEQ